jgi:ABC-2 type transport system permease protein
MIADIRTMLWKEWKEWFLPQGSARGQILNLLFLIGVFGIFLPIQSGRDWVQSWVPIFWTWMPVLLVIGSTTDAFAGERERHTLETLLASRLSDRAILFGKLGAAIGYGAGLALVSQLLGLVVVNLLPGGSGFVFYSPAVGLGVIGFSLLGAGLAAGTGVLVSLHAATVRQANQWLMIPLSLVAALPSLAFLLLPDEWKLQLLANVQNTGAIQLVGIILAVLLVIDLGLVGAVMARFRRTQLILD